MEGPGRTLGSMASLDRKLERMLAAYRPVQIQGETDSSGPRQSGQAASLDDDECESLQRLQSGHANGSSRDDFSVGDSVVESGPRQGYSSGLSSATVDVGVNQAEVLQQTELGIRLPKVVNPAESASTAWTDDRHSSYLNSIEETFVKNMYDSDYVESRSSDGSGACTSNPAELFEMWQGGCWQSFYRPQAMELPTPPPPTVIYSPWVQHFYRRTTTYSSEGTSAAHQDGARAQDELVEENVLPDEVTAESKQVAQQPENGFLAWHSRLQQQIWKAPSSPSRKDNCGATGKRGSSEPGDMPIVDSLRSKRQKCQQTLALIDLEMEDQFSLGRLEPDVGDHVAGCQDDHEKPAHDQPQATQVVDPPTPLMGPCEKSRRSFSILEPKDMGRSRSVQRVLSRNNLCLMGIPPVDFDQVVPQFRSSKADDISGRVIVPDINSLPKQATNDGMCNCKGCMDVSMERCEHARADSNFEASQMVKESASAAEAASTANEEQSVPSCNGVHHDDEPTHHKRRNFQTWNWGLQGLRRPVSDKSGDSAE